MNSARQHCLNAVMQMENESPEAVVDVVIAALAQWYRQQASMCDMEKRWTDSVWYRRFADSVER